MYMECADKNSSSLLLDCGSSLTIDSIFDQKASLQQILLKKKPVIFRANKIIEIDTAVLQLLLNFTSELSKLHLTWTWEAPSSVLLQSAELLGMRELLKLPHA